jgi:lactate permease
MPIGTCLPFKALDRQAKIIDAQSIVVAATATNHDGQEGPVLRYVFLHSIALASLVGILVTLQASAWSIVAMVVH